MNNIQEDILSIQEALAALGVFEDTLSTVEKRALDEQGYIVLPNAIEEKWFIRLRESYEELMHKEGQNAGKEVHQEKGTRRLADLINKGEVFDGIYTHPQVLAAVNHIIGREFKVSATNGRDAIPGEGHQALHQDWGQSRTKNEPFHVAISLWMLDDFTTENGATRVVPGSHLWEGSVKDHVDPLATHPQEVLLTGKAGSIAVMNSHLWHGGTSNRTQGNRRALHPYYTAREFPQQQNMQEYIRKSTFDRISPAARYLLDVK
ncbi:phytanoyl-CoA dioxygenase family protein [Paenibacillus psychroresistens]|nr:phytanoyl-CoA dioxygenase family protein [Paenibacillus psychroresistens]